MSRGPQMVQVREENLLLEDGRKRTVYCLVIRLGKGRKRANLVRAHLEIALRQIVKELSA